MTVQDQSPKAPPSDSLMKEIVTEFKSLVDIVAKLRGPDGCPWDRQQTQVSLSQYAIEEAFELAEALETGDQSLIAEELGDFLFQVVLQAQVALDHGHFSLKDVVQQLNRKMIERHPHVFNRPEGGSGASLEEIWSNWHKIKSQEKSQKEKKRIFSYPQNLPALQAANKIGVKSKSFNFDWNSATDMFDKLEEEIQELREAFNDWKMTSTPAEEKVHNLNHELGDVLFSLAQLARHTNIDPEQSLRECNRRFQRRFERAVQLSGLDRAGFAASSNRDKEDWWQQAKKIEG